MQAKQLEKPEYLLKFAAKKLNDMRYSKTCNLQSPSGENKFGHKSQVGCSGKVLVHHNQEIAESTLCTFYQNTTLN